MLLDSFEAPPRSAQVMAEPLVLLVIANGAFTTHPLPETGEVVIGRTDGCDVRVDDRSLSRRHAVLHVGPALEIEDLGSANGTRLRDADAPRSPEGDLTAEISDAPLAPGRRVRFDPGDVVVLGTVLAIVQAAPAAALTASRARTGAPPVVVVDPAMRRLHELIERLANSRINVLLLGETGVGKEVLAEKLHACSPRAQKALLRLNCASLSEPLLESELFGHEKGAFTGATSAKPGLLETADGGTVFLDEVGELPLGTQAKLLRVIEERRLLRVGGLRPKNVDVRFVAASNRDLAEEIEAGRFRRDLYYRLNGITLTVPPLRQRSAELEELARCLAAQAASDSGRSAAELTSEALAALLSHTWPGNVRELKNVIERAVVLAGDGPIRVEHLQLESEQPASTRDPATDVPSAEPATPEDAERSRILAALERCAGNQTVAAKLLGISRRTLVTRLGELGIPRPRKARDLLG
jgi:two-component system, NtrC family, response regulator AtoC